MEQFSGLTQEKLGYYIYCLIDPIDHKVLYIGKGKGNRVFQHALHAEKCEDEATEKIARIKEIHERTDGNNNVGYSIIRHGLDNNLAIEIESVLIDILTHQSLNTESILTNIQGAYDQRLRGISTVEEVEAHYAAKDINVNPEDFILLVNIAGSSKSGTSLYEATRGDWIIGKEKQQKITHALAHHNGVVRAVFRPTEWIRLPKENGERQRSKFKGELIVGSPYLNTSVRKYTFFFH